MALSSEDGAGYVLFQTFSEISLSVALSSNSFKVLTNSARASGVRLRASVSVLDYPHLCLCIKE